jgi:hypothetical protein
MVVDFAKDEYHLSGPELDVLAEKVRSGDLTTVLKAWEQDIKVSSRQLSASQSTDSVTSVTSLRSVQQLVDP